MGIKIVVYHELNCDNIIFEGQVDSTKRLNILYDDVEHQYHVIANLTAAIARKFVCEGCKEACTSDVRHPATRNVATALPVPRAHSRGLESPVRNEIGTFEVTRVSRNTSSAPRSRNQYVNERGAVRRADGS